VCGAEPIQVGAGKTRNFSSRCCAVAPQGVRVGKEIDHEKGVIWEHQIKVQGRRAITSGT